MQEMQERRVQSLGRKIPWSKKWQPAPVFLPGELLWTEEPGGLQSMESQRVGYTELLSTAHTLLSHKKECILVCPNEVDEPRAYYTE